MSGGTLRIKAGLLLQFLQPFPIEPQLYQGCSQVYSEVRVVRVDSYNTTVVFDRLF